MSNSPAHPDDLTPDKSQAASSRVTRRHQQNQKAAKARELLHAAHDATKTAATPPKSANERVITVEIPPQTEFVRVARLAASGVASRMRFTYDQIEDIKLAISEACNNAILHARPNPNAEHSAPSSIVVRFWPHDDRLEISVEDGGHVPPPGLPLRTLGADEVELALDDLPESGMGLMLIQALMDEVQQPPSAPNELPSTRLHMTKRLRSL